MYVFLSLSTADVNLAAFVRIVSKMDEFEGGRQMSKKHSLKASSPYLSSSEFSLCNSVGPSCQSSIQSTILLFIPSGTTSAMSPTRH